MSLMPPSWDESQAYARSLPRVAVMERQEFLYEVCEQAYTGIIERYECGHSETNNYTAGINRPARWRRCWRCALERGQRRFEQLVEAQEEAAP